MIKISITLLIIEYINILYTSIKILLTINIKSHSFTDTKNGFVISYLLNQADNPLTHDNTVPMESDDESEVLTSRTHNENIQSAEYLKLQQSPFVSYRDLL